jgi:hypothetical protein
VVDVAEQVPSQQVYPGELLHEPMLRLRAEVAADEAHCLAGATVSLFKIE